MLRSRKLSVVFLAAAVWLGPAFAQEEVYKSEVSVQGLVTFVSSTWSSGVQQTATDTGGALANYRFFFNDYSGVEVNYGYTLSTQKYLLPLQGQVGVKADSHEGTAAYVLRYPAHRVKPFALVGGGGLIFDPWHAPQTAQARAAFIYGGGLDVGFAHSFFLRAQYRGFVYSTPDFNTPYLGPNRITHLAEPSIGFGVRF